MSLSQFVSPFYLPTSGWQIDIPFSLLLFEHVKSLLFHKGLNQVFDCICITRPHTYNDCFNRQIPLYGLAYAVVGSRLSVEKLGTVKEPGSNDDLSMHPLLEFFGKFAVNAQLACYTIPRKYCIIHRCKNRWRKYLLLED